MHALDLRIQRLVMSMNLVWVFVMEPPMFWHLAKFTYFIWVIVMDSVIELQKKYKNYDVNLEKRRVDGETTAHVWEKD